MLKTENAYVTLETNSSVEDNTRIQIGGGGTPKDAVESMYKSSLNRYTDLKPITDIKYTEK